MSEEAIEESKKIGYLQHIFIGILSQFSFFIFIILIGLLFFPLYFLDIKVPTSWFYLICSLLFLLVIGFVYKNSNKLIYRVFLFGLIPSFITVIFYTLIPTFAMETTSSWSGQGIFSVDPSQVHTISESNIPMLFVPKDIVFFISTLIVITAFLLSLFPIIKKYGQSYLLTSISAIFFYFGIILFFAFLNSASGPEIAGAYVPLLFSGVILLNYFAFKKYSVSILIRWFSIFIIFLSFGIIQDFGLGHLPILWTPIDFICVCFYTCSGELVIFWSFSTQLSIGCFEAYLLSWISTLVYWVLLSRLVIFAWDKFKSRK